MMQLYMSQALWKKEFNAFEKSINPFQPAQSTQADIGQNFLLSLIFMDG